MDVYQSFCLAFDYFNESFFEGRLPQCVFTLQRVWRVKGYFMEARFREGDNVKGEISLNPAYFGVLSDFEVLATLVHEMCHLNQYFLGNKSCPGYHTKKWASDMRRCGLIPSSTGKEGGKETGYRITQFIPDDSFFYGYCRKILGKGFSISFRDRLIDSGVAMDLSLPSGKKDGNMLQGKRFKYSCPCGNNVWGKKSLLVICGFCGKKYIEV